MVAWKISQNVRFVGFEYIFFYKCTWFYWILFCSPMAFMAPLMSSMSAVACRSHSTKSAHIRFLSRMGIHVIFKVSRLCKGFRTQTTLMSSFTWSCMFLLHVQVQFDLINHCSTYWTWHRFMSIPDMSDCLKRIGLHFHK